MLTARWDRAARDQRRWVVGSALGGGALASLLVGMTLGGAFAGVDVALPPAGGGGQGPRVEYASPTTSGNAHSTSRPATHDNAAAHRPSPATAAAGATTPSSGSTQAQTGDTPSTTAPSAAPSGGSTSGSSSPTSPTTVPTTSPGPGGGSGTPTPTTPTTTVPGSGGGGSGPLQQVGQKIFG